MRSLLAVCLCVCFISGISFAGTVTVGGIDLDFVTIGNAGNAADSTGYGAVDYAYQIGKYEITNGQWNAFVSAAGAPTGNPSHAYDGSAYWTGTNVPTNSVSWYEAAQFCNYLTSGDRYSGAYNFSQSGDFLGVDRASAISAYGTTYVIPTEDEWYKAAYYTGSGYSLYANGTNTAPIAGTDTNYDYVIGQPWEVGVGNGTQEQNGTYDMMGNVWEWNEALISGPSRGIRGGSYYVSDFDLSSSIRGSGYPNNESISVGFRVASVPEPCSLVLLGLGGLALRYRKR
ncbi:aerobic sulfatase maturase family protein [Sedimentisphaera cyanobacteriorum]|uniref:Aerobic sulfatase maturase family protein n=1 Tax=Sedimentisphaera cyanobacteriorum TaxID=1940790 RepID=A0A1Q2HQW0_9BACT|nr:formylglycine-generating enzyme family protein [Sedimentisphaera cyanobacteriorum]AQQ09838.1 aerobic sulfatase maturase family protein [Sedimentisphaera cyanobacteriorum]